MRIALLAHNKFPIAEPYAGGLEMLTHILAKRLVDRGHEVTLYALAGSDPDLNIVAFESLRSLNPEISETSDNSLMYAKALRHIESSNFDIVHNHSMHDLPIIWADNVELRVISTFHTPVFEDIHTGLSNCKFTNNQKFTVVSQSLGKVYNSLLKNPQVIYNGIDLKNWSFTDNPEKDQVCWIGRICKEKAPHIAVKLALAAGTKIVLAGPLSNEEYFKNHLEEYLDNPKVTYAGHLKQNQIDTLIGESEVTLFTSVWEEPYGLVIAESLACGTPVVAWEVGASREILTNDCGLTITPFSEKEFMEGIIKAVQMDRKNCRKRAEQFCDVEIMVDQYEQLYREEYRKRKSVLKIGA